jgi:hypothetical protein
MNLPDQKALEEKLLAALESGKFEEVTPDSFSRLREKVEAATSKERDLASC